MSFCYLNGQILEETKANLPISNLGLNRGIGVFDLFRSRNGTITFFKDYMERFRNSQKFLNLARQITENEIRLAVKGLQSKNGFPESTFKMVLLADGMDLDVQFDPFFFILNTELPEGYISQPSSLITYEYVREYPEIKTLNYLTGYRLHQRKLQAGAIDVLYHENGLLSETSRSNIFIVKDGVIATPDQNILQGITRKNILKTLNNHVEIRSVAIQELFSADEVFITSTIKEIMPILMVDEREIGSGHVGPVTKDLIIKFQQLTRA